MHKEPWSRFHLLQLGALLTALLFLTTKPADSAEAVDLVFRQGLIIDGTGGAAAVGDVAIQGDKIVGIGPSLDVEAAREIDCRGRIIAPGFIDLHNHSDRQVIQPATRGVVNYLTQGCTTIVTGNCGSGPIDVDDYYRAIDSAGAGTNVAHLIPQGQIRQTGVGMNQRPATADELQEMRDLVDRGMQAGAWGMSTGLIYVPSSYADTAELTALAAVVAKHNGLYASHIRGEGIVLLKSVGEALEIGKTAGLPVHVSHFKSSGRAAWGLVRQAAAMIETARAAGQTVTADQYPYIASSTSLGATLVPTWARAGTEQDLLDRLDNEETGDRLKESIADALNERNKGATLRIARYSKRQDWVGKSVAQIAEQEGRQPLEIALEIIRGGGASIVNFSMSEDDVRATMQLPWVATASDGRAYIPGADRPHPRSYGTFARKIGHYSRNEKVIPLPHAIRSCSGLPADILRMTDRGYVKSGQFADIVVFKLDAIQDRATFDDPHQYSVGFDHVFVNGQPALSHGTPTGALAGRALRYRGDR